MKLSPSSPLNLLPCNTCIASAKPTMITSPNSKKALASKIEYATIEAKVPVERKACKNHTTYERMQSAIACASQCSPKERLIHIQMM